MSQETWESDPLLYALDARGALVHIDSVNNGLACGCVCPSCKQPLVAKNGGHKVVHHFAHKSGACKWAAETAVVLLVREILAAEERMRVHGATYLDPCTSIWPQLAPHGWLAIRSISAVELEGRQAPALRIGYVDQAGYRGELVLVAALASRVSDGLTQHFETSGSDVLVMDFKSAYAGMRNAQGRHFSRAEFFMHVQDPTFLRSVLLGGANAALLRWLVHPRRDIAAAEANRRYQEQLVAEREAARIEAQRRQEAAAQAAEQERVLRAEAERLRAEQELARLQQLEREREAARLQEAREQAEREKKKAAIREESIEAERRAFENEGVEALMKVKRGVHLYADDCPLYGQANLFSDCGAYSWSPDTCIFFEGQRYYMIGCTARQNGVGLDDE